MTKTCVWNLRAAICELIHTWQKNLDDKLGLEIITNQEPEVKSNLWLYSLYYAGAYNEFLGPIFAPFHLGNKAPFGEILQRWRAVGNVVSNLSGPRF